MPNINKIILVSDRFEKAGIGLPLLLYFRFIYAFASICHWVKQTIFFYKYKYQSAQEKMFFNSNGNISWMIKSIKTVSRSQAQ